jgi:polysaccharide biosynthesis/export protein
MKIKIDYKQLVFIGFLLFLNSCASRKDIAYLQDIDSKKSQDNTVNYEIKLQPDDRLSIIVSAENPEITNPFNLPFIQSNYAIENGQSGIKTYLIDKEGYIDFPVLGQVQLANLTRVEANKKMVGLVSKYIKEPIVNIAILNYKISVLGEVNRPGTFALQSERITLLEALALAGDLTVFGKRNNVILIRETNGKKSYNRIDLTSASFIDSPYYYLTQNDLLLVEPNKTKMNTSKFGPNITSIISVASLLVTTAIIIFRK